MPYCAAHNAGQYGFFVPGYSGCAGADFGEAIGVIGGVERKIHFLAFLLVKAGYDESGGMIMCRLSMSVFAIASILSTGSTFAHEFKAGSITIGHPWSRATPDGAQVAAGYLTIENDAAAPDRLVSATAEIAGKTQIHLMTMVDGVMKMREVSEGVPVPPHGTVALDPNAYHLMFNDLKRPLTEGEEFKGTLTFEKAGTVDVMFEVEAMGAATPKPDERQN